jgi:hypothetical protein
MNNSQLPFNPDEFANRIIDGSNSETLDQLYFVGSAKSYIKKVDTGNSLTVKASGNFFSNVAGQEFRDILDGGTSTPGSYQYYGVIVGGVFPTEKNGI